MLDFKTWQAQQSQPSATDLANRAISSGNIDWQGLYDPLQKYYWDSVLGGHTIKTRELLGYGENNQSLESLLDPSVLSDPWADPTYAAQFANYSDWKDVNIQDFAGVRDKYLTPWKPVAEDIGPPSGRKNSLDYSLVDVGEGLKGNVAFDYLFNRDIDTNKWLADQGIDLREGTGWRPGEELNATDPYTLALQKTIAPSGKKDLLHRPWHLDADLTGKSNTEIQHYMEGERNPLGAVAGFLDNYDNDHGNANGTFYDNKAVKDWAKGMDAANPGFVKGLFQSPAGALILGAVTGGLGLVGTTAGGLTAATGGAISGGAATAAGGALVGAGTGALGAGLTGGNIAKGALGGALSGGLGQYTGNYLNNNVFSPVIGNNAFSQALSQGAVKGATSALMGGGFGSGFASGALNSGVNSFTNDYINPTLGGVFSPEVADWLSKTGGRVLGNVVNGRKNDPASLARMSFTDWASSQSKP